MLKTKQKVIMKEEYCFNDVDKIIELYLSLYEHKIVDEFKEF